MEETFYRQLFLRRYARLLEKAEQTFGLSRDTMEILRRQILSLDWVDPAIARIHTRPSRA